MPSAGVIIRSLKFYADRALFRQSCPDQKLFIPDIRKHLISVRNQMDYDRANKKQVPFKLIMIPDSFIKKMNLFQVLRSIFLFGMTVLGFLLSGIELNAQEWEPEGSYELIDQLYEFAEENNFTVRGTEKIGSMDSRIVRGDLETKIEQLLAGFNYMLIRSNEGQIVKLIIMNKIVKRPNQIVLNSKKIGRNHIVSVSLKGISGDWVELDLIVDTGSEFTVLPDSMMEKLGYSSENMPTRTLQTVNGITDAKTAQLEAIEIGNRIIADVGVAFVKDELLGNMMLLGMNVLGRYRLTIDDKLNQITLTEVD